jgi:hypothetical protein
MGTVDTSNVRDAVTALRAALDTFMTNPDVTAYQAIDSTPRLAPEVKALTDRLDTWTTALNSPAAPAAAMSPADLVHHAAVSTNPDELTSIAAVYITDRSSRLRETKDREALLIAVTTNPATPIPAALTTWTTAIGQVSDYHRTSPVLTTQRAADLVAVLATTIARDDFTPDDGDFLLSLITPYLGKVGIFGVALKELTASGKVTAPAVFSAIEKVLLPLRSIYHDPANPLVSSLAALVATPGLPLDPLFDAVTGATDSGVAFTHAYARDRVAVALTGRDDLTIEQWRLLTQPPHGAFRDLTAVQRAAAKNPSLPAEIADALLLTGNADVAASIITSRTNTPDALATFYRDRADALLDRGASQGLIHALAERVDAPARILDLLSPRLRGDLFAALVNNPAIPAARKISYLTSRRPAQRDAAATALRTLTVNEIADFDADTRAIIFERVPLPPDVLAAFADDPSRKVRARVTNALLTATAGPKGK